MKRTDSVRARDNPRNNIFVSLLVGLFLIIASVSLAAYALVAWSERQILDSENWVSYASSLPENPDVAWALSDKITNQIFESVPVQDRITEVLPPRAGFLAGPLTDQLRQRTQVLLQNIVQGDRFQGAWSGANKLASDRILTRARAETPAEAPTLQERFNVNLQEVLPNIQERVDKDSPIANTLQERGSQLLEINAGLETKRQQVRQIVQTTDFLYKILPAVFVASFLGMLAFARNKRTALLSLAGASIVLLLTELIAIKYARQQLLARVENDQYIPAVSHIFDSLVASFQSIIYTGLVAWLLVFLLAILFGNQGWAISTRRFLHLQNISKSRPAGAFMRLRAGITHYRGVIMASIVILGLAYLAFIGTIDTVVIVNSVLIILSLIFLVKLAAVRRPFIQSKI